VKILLIDNFDSFTFNLAHYLTGMDVDVSVLRENDYRKGVAEHFDKIILSPGSGLPEDRKGMMLCIQENIDSKPILGVCLGMQALVLATGGKLYNQKVVKHGVQESIQRLGDSKLLNKVPDVFEVGLYHSWAVDFDNKSEWLTTSISSSKIIMSIESKSRSLFGVQFHPESIMTPEGRRILQNFLEHYL
jgi:anthranilate synthase component II